MKKLFARALRPALLTLALSLAGAASAVPAKRDLRTVTQPDGTTLKVRLVGDESRHFLLTEDNMIVAENPSTGAYEFARILPGGLLESTGVQAADPAARSLRQMNVATSIADPAVTAILNAPASPRRIAQTGMGAFTNGFPKKGDVKVLIILVNYKDVKFNLSDPTEYFESMLNKEGFSEYGGTGSCKDYFRDNSNGQFVPHFDLYGPVDLPQTRRYYGNNDMYGNDRAPEEMVIDACKALDDQIDFSLYDNDKDGVVDNVYIFYAGQGEADGGPKESVWPHSWELTNAKKELTLDGVTIDRYACSNEWVDNKPCGIGTFVHEFSHVIGLPDLYCTNYGSADNITPGEWSVMDYGPYNNDGRTPPAYSIYERNAMTWIEPTVIDGPISITLEDIKDSNSGCIIPCEQENEFFLFENRQQKGWDKYIPGHGMLIWHVDYDPTVFDSNVVNNSYYHQYVDIIEANNQSDKTKTEVMAGYAWPGTSGNTEFSKTSTPAMKSWYGNLPDLPLTEITETDGVVSFLVAGGNPRFDKPVCTEPTEVGKDYFIATWNPVEGANDYLVNLYAKGKGELETDLADMGSGSKPELPEGWGASAILGYTSAGNYGTAAPSFKLSTDGAFLETKRFLSDITEISFWCKGQQADGSTLTIYGHIGKEWVKIKEYAPKKTEVLNVKIDDLPAGVRAVKFVWAKVKGNLAIDDIEIKAGATDLLVSSLKTTTGLTTARFDGLEAGNYYYTVAATDGEYTTPFSQAMPVQINVNGISTLTLTTRPEYFDLTGRRITAPAPGSIYIERRGAQVTKRIAPTR